MGSWIIKLLLLQLVLLLTKHADSNSIVRYLPDFEGPLPFELETGGDHSMQVPFTATQAWIRSLNYIIIDDWRPWMIHNKVAGYTKTYANKMTFATVKGGAHTAEFKPEESSVMFKRWISGQLL